MTTATPSPMPTPAIPKVDSSNENFYVYSEQEKQEIGLLSDKYDAEEIKTRSTTGFILAYYEDYDMTDTRLLVVLGTSADVAESLYGSDWIEVFAYSGFGEPEEVENCSYGSMTVKQIVDMLFGQEVFWVFVANDDTVLPNMVNDVKLSDVTLFSYNEQWRIYVMRCDGEVSVYETDGTYEFGDSAHDDWELY